MIQQNRKTSRKRERNCFDRHRLRLIEGSRRRQSNCALSVAAQFVALFATLFGRTPISILATAPYIAPPQSPAQARRNELARYLGVPARYGDVALSQGRVPYTLLFDHIRRGGATRVDAMEALRQRVPDAALDWLDHIRRSGLWSDLLRCYDRDGTEEDTDVKILKSTLAWLSGGGRETGSVGPDQPGTALTPGIDPNDEDPKNDPNKPKL